jgi:hypothetical protein
MSCERFAKLIQEEMTEGLPAGAAAELRAHLQGCADCRREQKELQAVWSLLGEVRELAPPRHFFAYEPAKRSPLSWFRGLSASRALALAAGAAFVFFVGAAAATVLQVDLDQRALTFRLGARPEAIDANALKAEVRAEVFEELQEASRQRQLEWVQTLRSELEQNLERRDREQQQFVAAFLSQVESRLQDSVRSENRAVQQELEGSMARFYELLTQQHEDDLRQVHLRLNQVAVSDAIRGTETEAIMATLRNIALNRD